MSRRKACDGCVRAKIRCNLDPAGCSRCTSRGNPCTYRGRLSRNPGFGSPTPAATGSRFPQDELPEINRSTHVDSPALPLDEFGPGVVAPSIDTISGNSQLSHTPLTWDNEVFGARFLDTLDVTTPLNGDYHLGVTIEAPHASPEAQHVSDYLTASSRPRQPSPSNLASLSYQDPSSMLERRNFSEPELDLTGDLTLHILRSYLYVMADRDSVPPFIHPKYQNLMEMGTSRPSPLYAAMKLAKMLFLGRRMNKTLIWRLIRMEQERLLNDVRTTTLELIMFLVANQVYRIKHPKFDKWEILEALQSLVLYILMRITEGRHDYTNFDTQLLITVNVSSHSPTSSLLKHAYSQKRNKGTLSLYHDKFWHAHQL